MTAIISVTYDDQYLFYLPIVVWCWNKLGFKVVVIGPDMEGETDDTRIDLVIDQRWEQDLQFHWVGFEAPPEKNATYAQCSRLYAAAFKYLLPRDEVLITSDADMIVLNKDYLDVIADGRIHVFGADLVPEGQYPMCYISMTAATWCAVMGIEPDEKIQHKLDQLLGHLDCEHFRGNYWCKDQETIFKQLEAGGWSVTKHSRAKLPHRFATRRADRDGWPVEIPEGLIDAHLPRPGYTEENFAKIMNLIKTYYPHDDVQWMYEYHKKYNQLLNEKEAGGAAGGDDN